MDFDKQRVEGMFKDASLSELKEGMTTREINTISAMTPTSRVDLQRILQLAYNLAYAKEHQTLQISNVPVSAEQQPVPIAPPEIPQQKAAPVGSETPYLQAFKEFKSKVDSAKEEMPSQIVSQNLLMNDTVNNRDELLNKVYELERVIEEKNINYKNLEQEYQTLQTAHTEAIAAYNAVAQENETLRLNKDAVVLSPQESPDLVSYLKNSLSESEKKIAYLHQEIGKLRGMFGV